MLKVALAAALLAGFAVAETPIPKDATQTSPGVYKQTSSDGKTYIFRKTPFGVVKSLEKPEASAPKTEEPAAATPKPGPTPTPFGDVKTSAPVQHLKIVDRGDVLEFERPSPFGSYKWKRKKDELNQVERDAWERTQKASATTAGPKATGPKE